MALTIEREDRDGVCAVMANGDIDLASSPKLRQALLAAVDDYPSVQVHLAKIGYMDSSGVATLVEALKASRAQDKSFELHTPSSAVMKVLQLARLDSLFTIVGA